jgi:enoyl-CoA hydratase
MMLTGRGVAAKEALEIGLVNRLVSEQDLLVEAERLAAQIAAFPQQCMRGDRRSAYEQWGLSEEAAVKNEFVHGIATLRSGESVAGAARFSGGKGRHGELE